MNILVSGCCGHIGCHLCALLLSKGNSIIGIDNLSTGHPENKTLLLEQLNLRFIEHDICQTLSIDEHIDQIYHLASRASPRHYYEAPLETAMANSIGTLKMLELAKEKNARILFASTSEIYGNPEMHPQNESYIGAVSPVGMRSCYSESKRFGETLMTIYSRSAVADTRIARLFNTYGPNMAFNDGRVIPNLIINSLNNESITVHGKGMQTRSFCYVSDTVRGLYKLMESDYNKPVNIGNSQEIRILELANIIKKLCDSDAAIEFMERFEDDPDKRCPDISIAEKYLGWKPKVGLEEGLRLTISWFKENMMIP
ncbi:MAG: GDP-mannose 4,6-dehydratase [Candidatus Krumholzibacteriota bacterium]|nr:GDP-mannose 4,6-dehydratase [Candidatus Krumholzibacteriota bacterium]